MSRLDPKLKQVLDVRVQGCRPSKSFDKNPDPFCIEISDKKSGLIILELELTIEEFVDMVSSRSTTGKAEYYGSPNIGKEQEIQHVTLYAIGWNIEDVRTAAKNFEAANPSWTVDQYDLDTFKSHRYDSKNRTYRVTARRWV